MTFGVIYGLYYPEKGLKVTYSSTEGLLLLFEWVWGLGFGGLDLGFRFKDKRA